MLLFITKTKLWLNINILPWWSLGSNLVPRVLFYPSRDSLFISLSLCRDGRVSIGHGKPGKLWNLRISFSRSGKSWNLIFSSWRSWKIKVLFGRLVTTGDKARTMYRGFIKGRAPGKLTGCEHDFARLLYISKNFFLIQGTIKNSFKLQSCPFLDESYRV